jgi:GT2 family glycosyltransferase
VVDNRSSDSTPEIVSSYSSVIACDAGANVGFGPAVNIGVGVASRDFVLVLNPDTKVVDVADPSPAEFDVNDSFGLRACRLADTQSGQSLVGPSWHWRAELYWFMVNCFVMPREIDLGRPRLLGLSRRPTVVGAAFIVRRNEFLRLGGFDGDFFLYFEDFDLSRNYRQAGLPVAETSAVVVQHAAHTSSPRNLEQMIAFALQGLIEYVHNWEAPGTSERAAGVCLTLLERLQTSAMKVRRVPIVGSRASKNGARAAAVHQLLRNHAEGSEFVGNPNARLAFARQFAFRRRRSDAMR